MVESPPASAGNTGSIPWSGKIPHAMGHLSPWATATEPRSPRACALQQEKAPKWEAPAPQLESSPCSPQLEKARTQQQRPRTAKNKHINTKKPHCFFFLRKWIQITNHKKGQVMVWQIGVQGSQLGGGWPRGRGVLRALGNWGRSLARRPKREDTAH